MYISSIYAGEGLNLTAASRHESACKTPINVECFVYDLSFT